MDVARLELNRGKCRGMERAVARSKDYPFFREVKSPITKDQLAPLDRRCERVQFASPLTRTDHIKLSGFLAAYPGTPLRVYGHYSEGLPDLRFLTHYPHLSGFEVDVFLLNSTEGVEYLPESLTFFGMGQTKTKGISLDFLRRFSRLKTLSLEGQTKGIESISTLRWLERLTLRSITLPDLKVLLPLRRLWWLAIKLGGTKDVQLLCEIGKLKYLELWMIKGLTDLSVVAKMTSLQNLFLQALKNVTALPSLRKLTDLRRVTLDTMKSLTDLAPVADAPVLEELLVIAAKQLTQGHFICFRGHPALKAATIGLGSIRKNAEVQELLGVPQCAGLKSSFSYR